MTNPFDELRERYYGKPSADSPREMPRPQPEPSERPVPRFKFRQYDERILDVIRSGELRTSMQAFKIIQAGAWRRAGGKPLTLDDPTAVAIIEAGKRRRGEIK